MKLPVSKEFIIAAAEAATNCFRAVLGRGSGQARDSSRQPTAPRLKKQRTAEDDEYCSDDDGPAFDEEALDHDLRAGTGVDHLRAGGARQTHASNVQDKQRHFRDALPRLISSACHAAVDVGMLWNQQQALVMTELQGYIDQWPPVHYECPQASSGSSPAATIGTHSVLYSGTHVTGHITVPDCQCTACGARFPMPAPAAGCVERSHKRPNLWVDTRMCMLYHHLRDSGVAYDPWVTAVTDHQSQHACAPSPAPWRRAAPAPADPAPADPAPASSIGDSGQQCEAQSSGEDGVGRPVACDWQLADPGEFKLQPGMPPAMSPRNAAWLLGCRWTRACTRWTCRWTRA